MKQSKKKAYVLKRKETALSYPGCYYNGYVFDDDLSSAKLYPNKESTLVLEDEELLEVEVFIRLKE